MSTDNSLYGIDKNGMGDGDKRRAKQTDDKNTYIFHITPNGKLLAGRIESYFHGAISKKFGKDEVSKCWSDAGRIVFVMASGIAVRTIAPMLADKRVDPAVIVIDEKGEHVISLCGGHLAGANEFAVEVSKLIGAAPVITTSSDVNNLPAIDLWARDNDLEIENAEALPKLGVKLMETGSLRLYVDGLSPYHYENLEDNSLADDPAYKEACITFCPDEFETTTDITDADIIISARNDVPQTGFKPDFQPGLRPAGITDTGRIRLVLRPKNIVVGIGCNKGTEAKEIEDAVSGVLKRYDISTLSVAAIATIDIKGDEGGLVEYVSRNNLDLVTFSASMLNTETNGTPNMDRSDTVFKATGAYAVAEPAAILAAKSIGEDRLAKGRSVKHRSTKQRLEDNAAPRQSLASTLVPKQKIGNVTVAVAAIGIVSEKKDGISATSLFIVGTGPGSVEHITPYAQKAIAESDVIVGYHTYLRLIPELIENKELVATGMTKELVRCEKAVDQALSGKNVCVISGGDPGIYAMAGLIFEVLKAREAGESVDVEIVPGISALNACAARLGAPLMHDFAAISLSDRLTPWDLIEKRLEAAASADFVIALYNPRSKGRRGHIEKARDIIMKHRSPDTPVGLVKAAMRPDEQVVRSNLAEMLDFDIDMQTTVIVGNSSTFLWNDKMVTPRGYTVK